jgi:hypothetical protein
MSADSVIAIIIWRMPLLGGIDMSRPVGSPAIPDRSDAVRSAFRELMKSGKSGPYTAIQVQTELARLLGKRRGGSTVRETWRIGRDRLLRSGDLELETGVTPHGPRVMYRLARERLVFDLPLKFKVVSAAEFYGPSNVSRKTFEMLSSPWSQDPARVAKKWEEVLAWRRANPEYRRRLADERRTARKNAAEERLARKLSDSWVWRPNSDGAIPIEQVRAFYKHVRAELAGRTRRRGASGRPSTHSVARRTPNPSRGASSRPRRERLAREASRST